MNEIQQVPWKHLFDFVYECGCINDYHHYCINILNKIGRFCPFDMGLVYFLDGNGEIFDQYLINIDASWSNYFLECYGKGTDSVYNSWKKSAYPHPEVTFTSWKGQQPDNVISNYIRPRGVKYTLGIGMTDTNNLPRAMIVLERTSDRAFTIQELSTLSFITPQLNNLHQKFYTKSPDQPDITAPGRINARLTDREQQIAEFLCRGMSPKTISAILHIALSTTNRHISNIYQKMGVKSRYELVSRMTS